MQPRTVDQVFREWLDTATIEEMDEELRSLAETNVSILSQIEEYDFRIKSQSPTPEDEEWRLRASHSQRKAYFQLRTIERERLTLGRRLEAEVKVKNGRANAECSRLKSEREMTKDRVWIIAAKEMLDAKTICQIGTLAHKKMTLACANQQLEKA